MQLQVKVQEIAEITADVFRCWNGYGKVTIALLDSVNN